MVEDSVTDPTRIAQLLASELTGRDDGTHGRLGVVDADADAAPSPDGTVAYGVAVDGDRVGDVVLYPDRAALELSSSADALAVTTVLERSASAGLDTERDDGAVVIVSTGARVKRVVDALVAGVA